jgi:transposase-like protein
MVVQACYVEGVSLSGVALAHELNPNLLRRWVTEFESGAKELSAPNNSRTLALTTAGDSCETAKINADIQTNAANTQTDSHKASLGDFLPIKVQASCSHPCRIEIQISKAECGATLNIAAASATLADCTMLIREFLQ